MSASDPPILLDNCAISACVASGAWTALAARYTLETVETVESEAGTGYQNRVTLDPREFRQNVKVHQVNLTDRLAAQGAYAQLGALDDGERDLWVHALGRSDSWILCGPDIASIRFGVEAGFSDRLISLEALLTKIGFRPKQALQLNQTEKWLSAQISKFLTEIAFRELDRGI